MSHTGHSAAPETLRFFINPVHAQCSDIEAQLLARGHECLRADFNLLPEYERAFSSAQSGQSATAQSGQSATAQSGHPAHPAHPAQSAHPAQPAQPTTPAQPTARPAALIDARCPRASALAASSAPSALRFSPLPPILIATAKRLFERDSSRALHVLCPCRSLAEAGNALAIDGLHFYDAASFIARFCLRPHYRHIPRSPVQLRLAPRSLRLSRASKIRRNFAKNRHTRFDFVELLYCKDGCHNSSEL